PTTRGQPRALAEVRSMLLGRTPHAVLFVGPASAGKTTLAFDLAAGLLCVDSDTSARPCRACRGCRLVATGNHPDLHRLAPEGPGGQVRIGAATDPDPGTVRHLIGELALLPVEGGARVAIVEQAHRLNEESQNALLKTLEEPPAGVTIILCADDEECLLPTVRSRCVRVRLGVVAGREIERWLGELGFADAPRSARLARLAGGRPGLALAYARSPDAERLRGEIARGLVDMLTEGRHARLAAVRDLVKSAAALDAALEEGRRRGISDPPGGDDATATTRRRRGRGSATAAGSAAGTPGVGEEADGEGDVDAKGEPATARMAASDRRSAAATLMEIWASIGRDLAVARSEGLRQLREAELVDEIRASATALDPGRLPAFLAQLTEVAAQLDENVNPELALDVLALSWPRSDGAVVSDAKAGARR
ncbi:MAG: DNA polymerase III subunit, partial [Candidatus Limnocylindrales bacterium]